MNYENRKIVKKYQIAIRRFLFDGCVKGKHSVFKYLNADRDKFKNYLESKFLDNMSWDNFGDVWQLGHIIAVEMFDHTNVEDLKICWNYKNYLPIYKNDNKVFGSCLLFSDMYFKHYNKSEEYDVLIDFIKTKLPVYHKYLK